MMFKQYKEMSPPALKVSDNQTDKNWLEGLFIFAALLLRLVNSKTPS